MKISYVSLVFIEKLLHIVILLVLQIVKRLVIESN